MRIHGIGVNLVDLRAYTGLTWAPLAIDARAALLGLNLPWPLYLPVGRLIFYDDLEGVLKWLPLEGDVTRDNSEHVFNGDYCLKIVTVNTGDRWGHSGRYLSFPGRGKFRLMCHWHGYPSTIEEMGTDLRLVRFRLDFFDGEYHQNPQIQYLNYLNAEPQEKWQYLNDSGAFVDIPGGAQSINCGPNGDPYPMDNFLALDVDITTGIPKITRLVSNELDLPDLDLTSFREETTRKDGAAIHFHVQSDVARVVSAYFDEIALGDKALPDLV